MPTPPCRSHARVGSNGSTKKLRACTVAMGVAGPGASEKTGYKKHLDGDPYGYLKTLGKNDMDMQKIPFRWTEYDRMMCFANSFPFKIPSPDITLSRLTPPFCLLSSAISFWALKNRSTTFRTKKIRIVSKFLKTQHISELKKRCRKFQTANQQIIFTLRFFWDFAIPKAEIATSINFCSNSSMRFFASFFQSKSSRENLPETRRFRVSSQDSTICNSDS